MSTVLALPMPEQHVVISRAVWDLYYQKTLERLGDVLNPELRRDLALDATIRSLGQRPQPVLAGLEPVAIELECHALRRRRGFEGSGNGQDGWRDRHIARRLAVEDRMEELCVHSEEHRSCG